jgi:tetratricopeptide (TPR) repeat protein
VSNICRRMLLLTSALLLLSALATAQSLVINLPRASQRAMVSQRIGITDITINYHRPLMNGRAIWGKVVPNDQVWRAGANENTTIEFSDPVSIEGKPLAKGVYGLHMIPGTESWTVIFSKNNASWGSFTYNEAEDALRVAVKPQPSELHNALTYDFDDLKDDAAVVTLRWEKLAVPFHVSVDVPHLTAASLREQVRGLAQYSWMGGDDAAGYLLANKLDLNEALKYSDQSLQNEERFDNLETKSGILTAMGRKAEADAAHAHALAIASPRQLYGYARGLQGPKETEEPYQIFRKLAGQQPDYWFRHAGMARLYSHEGKFDDALREEKAAIELAPVQIKDFLQPLLRRLEGKQDINK